MTVTGGVRTEVVDELPKLSASQATARQHAPVVLVGLVAAAAVMAVMRDRLPDDAYITLSYARNLAESGHWGLIEARTANTATSPLNVWLLAVVIALFGSPVLAVSAVLAGALVASGWWAARIADGCRLARWLPYAVVAVLAVNPLLISTVGLESYLAGALIVGLVRYALPGRWVATGALGGLLVLCRPDLGVIAVVVVLAVPAARRRWWASGAVGVAVALPWHLWSWWQLGGFVPDTLLFKVGDPQGWEGHRFATGLLLYLDHFPAATVLAVAPAAGGLMALVCVPALAPTVRSVVVAFGAAGIGHAAVYALLGTAPYAWYYAPALVGLTMAGLVGLASLGPTVHRAGAATAVVGVLATVGFLAQRADDGLGPIVYNYGTAAQYARMGTELGALVGPDVPIRDGIEIGTVAFFCRCTILEHFTDPTLAQPALDRQRAAAGPVAGWLLDFNAAHRQRSAPTPASWVVGFDGQPGYRARWMIKVPARGGHFLQLRQVTPARTG